MLTHPKAKKPRLFTHIIKGVFGNGIFLASIALTAEIFLFLFPVLGVAMRRLTDFPMSAFLTQKATQSPIGNLWVTILDRLNVLITPVVGKGNVTFGGGILLMAGLLIFFFTLTSVMNRQWGWRVHTWVIERFFAFLMFAFVTPFIIWGAAKFFDIFISLSSLGGVWLVRGMEIFSDYGIIFVWILFWYLIFPERKRRLLPAALGSLIATVALALLNKGLIPFVAGAIQNSTVPEGLTGWVLMAIWGYGAWACFLIGSQVMASFITYDNERIHLDYLPSGYKIDLALSLLKHMDRVIDVRRWTYLEDLAHHTRASIDQVEQALIKMSKSRIVQRKNIDMWGVDRNLEDITFYELLEAFDATLDPGEGSSTAGADPLLQKMADGERKHLVASLSDLIDSSDWSIEQNAPPHEEDDIPSIQTSPIDLEYEKEAEIEEEDAFILPSSTVKAPSIKIQSDPIAKLDPSHEDVIEIPQHESLDLSSSYISDEMLAEIKDEPEFNNNKEDDGEETVEIETIEKTIKGSIEAENIVTTSDEIITSTTEDDIKDDEQSPFEKIAMAVKSNMKNTKKKQKNRDLDEIIENLPNANEG